jgi:HSP20 family protein
MRRDDRDDPFDEFFQEIERLMNDMMGDRGEFHVETSMGADPTGPGPGDVHVDVHETDDSLRVVADLPGVEKDDVNLQCDGETLTIDAAGSGREYHERVRLPARVDEHSASASYNNGILEVAFDRSEESTDIDVS